MCMKLIVRYYENTKASVIQLAFIVAKNSSTKLKVCQFYGSESGVLFYGKNINCKYNLKGFDDGNTQNCWVYGLCSSSSIVNS
jgi:hypothetical protein